MMEIWIAIGVVAFVLLAVILVYISKYKTVGPDEALNCDRKLFRIEKCTYG